MIPLIVLGTSFAYVFAKAFQQLNVTNYRWAQVPIMSYLMGYMEYAGLGIGIADVIANGYERILVLGFAAGTGGWLGSWLGMWLYRRTETRIKPPQNS